MTGPDGRIVPPVEASVARPGDKALHSRVLRWLHDRAPRGAPPVDCVAHVHLDAKVDLDTVGNLQDAPLQPIGHVSAKAALSGAATTPKQRVAQLWKKCELPSEQFEHVLRQHRNPFALPKFILCCLRGLRA